ncbi:hypothetical protein BKA70DRAFT_1223522 [Coprinopsis sp. MPI-PUGE-AT-0042]|nr:hypothetical protein BKA70DRAFT_1223522 [Coprinopsis sp. MPI-PUGE-AT-0042]
MEGCWALVALRLARSMLVCLWLDEETALRYMGLGDQKLVRRIDVDVKVADSLKSVKMGKWAGECFIYTNFNRWLCYFIDSESSHLVLCSRVRQTRLRQVRSERGFDSALSLGNPDLTPDTARGAPAAEAAFNWKFLESTLRLDLETLCRGEGLKQPRVRYTITDWRYEGLRGSLGEHAASTRSCFVRKDVCSQSRTFIIRQPPFLPPPAVEPLRPTVVLDTNPSALLPNERPSLSAPVTRLEPTRLAGRCPRLTEPMSKGRHHKLRFVIQQFYIVHLLTFLSQYPQIPRRVTGLVSAMSDFGDPP